MDETIYDILMVLCDFALEVWFSIYKLCANPHQYFRFWLDYCTAPSYELGTVAGR